MSPKDFFHYISYLQYPLMLAALYYVLKPYFNGFNIDFSDLNNALIFMGLSISFSTLQDTTKTQNKISRKIWEDPVKGKLFLIFISLTTVFILATGITGFFSTKDSRLKDLSFGMIVFGIGMVGLLKAAIEMFDNHRKDKRQVESNE